MKRISEINESGPWIKPFDRAMTGDARKEDRDNLKDINWIDFGSGLDFLVADRYYVKGNQDMFTYEEMFEMFPEDGNVRCFKPGEFDSFSLLVKVSFNNLVRIKGVTADAEILLEPTAKSNIDVWIYADAPGKWNEKLRGHITPSCNDMYVGFGKEGKEYRILLIKEKTSVNESSPG